MFHLLWTSETEVKTLVVTYPVTTVWLISEFVSSQWKYDSALHWVTSVIFFSFRVSSVNPLVLSSKLLAKYELGLRNKHTNYLKISKNYHVIY